MNVMTEISAYADPREAACQVIAKWGTAFGEADVDGIAALYAPDALMIGTSGTTVLTKPEQIRNYFDIALNTGRPRTATLDSSEVLVIDNDTVVIAGLDIITSTREGQPVAARGRVTFVVARRGSEWKIVHLHRSPMPQL
jgi:uncharacterized protein (TIGR02246 family)